MRSSIFSLLLAAAVSSCGTIDSSDRCEFQSTPEVLADEEELLLQYWIEPDRPVLFTDALPRSESFTDFRTRMSDSFDTDPRLLLERLLEYTSGGDSENNLRVLEGAAGSIRPIGCLEALLFSTQTDRTVRQGSSMFDRPTEFLSYVLRKGDELKIYYFTVDQPGIRNLGVLSDPLDGDRGDGWEVVANVHNHNFFPDSERLMGGIAPSATDIQHLRMSIDRFGVRAAAITNGFHTLDMTEADFHTFSAP